MQRIGTTNNLFSDGDPSSGIKGTLLVAAWLNAVQEELAGIVEGAGLTLESNNNGQVWAALQTEFLKIVEGEATQAEAIAGVVQESYMSPLRVAEARGAAGQWTLSAGAAGYVVLPNGLIIQWGGAAVTGGTPATVSFPLAFPTGAYVIIASSGSASGDTPAGSAIIASTTQCKLDHTIAGNSRVVSFIVIGR